MSSALLPSRQKELVQALVLEHTQCVTSGNPASHFDDIVKGERQGLILVLHGPPGIGKTLTAECVIDLFKRPLYIVSSGDLLTNSSVLDERLRCTLEATDNLGQTPNEAISDDDEQGPKLPKKRGRPHQLPETAALGPRKRRRVSARAATAPAKTERPAVTTTQAATETLSTEDPPAFDDGRDHYFYKNNASREADGLFHCPFEEDRSCDHKPVKNKCNYDLFVDSHLKPYRCRVSDCEMAMSCGFSSRTCLLRHEREAHGMHGHETFPCPYNDCRRSAHAFYRRWNLADHLRRVHNNQIPRVALVSSPTESLATPRVEWHSLAATTTEKTLSTHTVNTPKEDHAQYLQQHDVGWSETTSTGGIQPYSSAATEATATDTVATYQAGTYMAGNDWLDSFLDFDPMFLDMASKPQQKAPNQRNDKLEMQGSALETEIRHLQCLLGELSERPVGPSMEGALEMPLDERKVIGPCSATSTADTDVPNDGPLYVCIAPGCNHSAFKRPTDLDRHYKAAHISDKDKQKFYCDYKKCLRNQEPFYRLERLRNHLRDYHKEDVPKQGVTPSAEWLKERVVRPTWWRCRCCLARVGIKEEACSSCDEPCESGRRETRTEE